MSWLGNLRTSLKLVLGFGLMILLLGATIAVGHAAIAALSTAQRELFERDFADASALLELRVDLNRQRVRMLELAVAPDTAELDRSIDDIRQRALAIDRTLTAMRERHRNDAKISTSLATLGTVLSDFRRARDLQIEQLRAGDVDGVRDDTAQADRYESLRAMAESLEQAASARAESSVQASQQRAADSMRLFIMIGLAALAIAAAVTVLLTRQIAVPLRQLTAVAERITVGDLAVQVPVTGRNDEVGSLAQAFERMSMSLRRMAAAAERIATGDLQETVAPHSSADVLGNAFARMTVDLRKQTSELIEAANVLGAATSEIVASTSQLAASASESAAAVNETTTTVEEVRQTVQLASQKAKVVSDSAQRAAQTSQAGRKSTDEVVEGMRHIRQQMDAIAISMARLSEQSQAIGQIIASVEDLATQSKLLAVNAAIEAAKAGEHGKGFGVVAQEVKSLAEQSRQATDQVRSLLGDIQKATSAAVMATEQGSKAVEAGERQTGNAGESILALFASVGEAAQAATQIAASSQQQLVGVDQVASAMGSIKQATAQNVASSTQLDAAARGLNQLGQQLKQMVERYRV